MEEKLKLDFLVNLSDKQIEDFAWVIQSMCGVRSNGVYGYGWNGRNVYGVMNNDNVERRKIKSEIWEKLNVLNQNVLKTIPNSDISDE